MKISISNFTANKTAVLTIKGQYKKYSAKDKPGFLCINNLDGQIYNVFNLDSKEITISKVGHIGLMKVSNFSLLK